MAARRAWRTGSGMVPARGHSRVGIVFEVALSGEPRWPQPSDCCTTWVNSWASNRRPSRVRGSNSPAPNTSDVTNGVGTGIYIPRRLFGRWAEMYANPRKVVAQSAVPFPAVSSGRVVCRRWRGPLHTGRCAGCFSDRLRDNAVDARCATHERGSLRSLNLVGNSVCFSFVDIPGLVNLKFGLNDPRPEQLSHPAIPDRSFVGKQFDRRVNARAPENCFCLHEEGNSPSLTHDVLAHALAPALIFSSVLRRAPENRFR